MSEKRKRDVSRSALDWKEGGIILRGSALRGVCNRRVAERDEDRVQPESKTDSRRSRKERKCCSTGRTCGMVGRESVKKITTVI